MSALGRELPFQAITAEELERAEEIAQAAIEHDFNNYDGDEAQEWIIDNRLIPDFEKVAKAYLSLRSRVSVQQSEDSESLRRENQALSEQLDAALRDYRELQSRMKQAKDSVRSFDSDEDMFKALDENRAERNTDSEREICPCCLGTGFIDVMNADYETLDAEITEERCGVCDGSGYEN